MKHKGSYRFYFKLPFLPVGVKMVNPISGDLPLPAFLAAIIMNLLEYKRYRYYTLLKPYRQWGEIWRYDRFSHIERKPVPLCPIYFSCGLFNIVAHCGEVEKREFEKLKEGNIEPYFGYLAFCTGDTKKANFGIYKNTIVRLDFGDFRVDSFNEANVLLIDFE